MKRTGRHQLKRKFYEIYGKPDVLFTPELSVYPSDVLYHFEDDPNSRWLAYETNTTDTFVKFDYNTPLPVLGGCEYKGKYGFQLYTLILVGNSTDSDMNGWYLQG